MIQTTHTTQVLQALPEGKLEEKKSRTKTGTVLVLFGLVLVVASFALGLRIVDNGADVTLLVLALVGAPLLLGVLLTIVGATVWSGELVTAGFRDVIATVRGLVGVFRKNGNGGASS